MDPNQANGFAEIVNGLSGELNELKDKDSQNI